ncbi:hypothetical protein H696_04020 [Fonticula alba]|uniref:Uncharacterized protein n=1 Tax=Fonticula alba TaxID=691883 RepID=A0A058Z5R8_FONAL|nr:hypothetical protein H696_04020 [Fonticula alba]KCV69600.1 hypothetical protein H696_04020 [Fonticula alba]|eukprot:XP_009496165.1 hypothetical protein H696_04020 [Fonticula alba]
MWPFSSKPAAEDTPVPGAHTGQSTASSPVAEQPVPAGDAAAPMVAEQSVAASASEMAQHTETLMQQLTKMAESESSQSLSCKHYFEMFFYCNKSYHKWKMYYVHGGLTNCDKEWDLVKSCFMVKYNHRENQLDRWNEVLAEKQKDVVVDTHPLTMRDSPPADFPPLNPPAYCERAHY